jgi:serine/threonine protein kinase
LENEQIKIVDFGLARYAFSTITYKGAGTINYMAPEVANYKDDETGMPSIQSIDFIKADLWLFI